MHKRKNDKTDGRTVKTISIQLPPVLAEAIRAKARVNDITVSRYFRGLINDDFVQAGRNPLF
jgi:hypothetical protein